MKKNILALFLALVLATSLVTPTLALEPPLWQQFEYDSKEEFMQDWTCESLTEADYAWLEERFQANIALVSVSLDEYSQGYYGMPVAEAKEYYEMDETQLIADLAADLTLSDFSSYRTRQQFGMSQTGINVQINGKFLSFSGAVPTYMEGNLVAPLSALAKGLGATTSNQAGATQLRYGGQQLTIVPGQAQLKSLQADGSTRSITAPVAPYQQGSELYVPLRAFGEALGLEVYYDEFFDCAVLLDKQTLIDQLDGHYKKFNQVSPLLNGFISQLNWKNGAQITSSMVYTLTELDSLDGNKQYPMNAKVTLKGKGDLFNLATNVKAESLVELLANEFGNMRMLPEAERLKMIDTLKQALKNTGLEVIVDTTTGTLYLHTPALAKLLQELNPNPISFSVDAWFKMTVPELLESPAIGNYIPPFSIPFVNTLRPNPGQTMGEFIWMEALGYFGYGYLEGISSPYRLYEQVQFLDKSYSALMGDANFTTQGARHSLNLDLSALDEVDELSLIGLLNISKLSGQFVFDLQAKTCTGQLVTRSEAYYYDSITQTTLNWNLSPNGLSLTGQTHERNTMQADFKIDAQWGSLQGELPSAPPAGAKIVDLDALFNQPTE